MTVAQTYLLLAREPKLVFHHVRLRRLSRKAFAGWSTTHTPRWWEYPWIVGRVRRYGSGGAAADFGAGRSPVPLALADLGYRTSVVDPDTLEGEYDNEWHFTDYTRWGIETIKAGMEDPVFEPGSLDIAVSVSVIEHIPAEQRRRGLHQIAAALKPDGVAVLSLDLMPDGKHLWNRVVDEVEPLDIHGTVEDFIGECAAAGLRVIERRTCPIRLPHLVVEAFVLTKAR